MVAGRASEEIPVPFAKLQAPDGAEDELKVMLVRLDDVTGDLRRVAAAARGHDPVKQRRAARALVRSSNAVQRAESKLKAAVGSG